MEGITGLMNLDDDDDDAAAAVASRDDDDGGGHGLPTRSQHAAIANSSGDDIDRSSATIDSSATSSSSSDRAADPAACPTLLPLLPLLLLLLPLLPPLSLPHFDVDDSCGANPPPPKTALPFPPAFFCALRRLLARYS